MTALIATSVLAISTAYSPCSSGSITADGTRVHDGVVASNSYALGTKLTVWPSPTGRRHFTVHDRIGCCSELDVWVASCSQAIQWGRRTVHVRKGWGERMLTFKAKPLPRRYEFEMGFR